MIYFYIWLEYSSSGENYDTYARGRDFVRRIRAKVYVERTFNEHCVFLESEWLLQMKIKFLLKSTCVWTSAFLFSANASLANVHAGFSYSL